MVVNVRDASYRFVSVACPLCTDGTRVTRDASAWQVHMEESHSADSDSWADQGIRGGQVGPADGLVDVIRIPQTCFGCGATFSTEALLIAHLSSVHSAS